MIGVSFKILARTPTPKLLRGYHPLPEPNSVNNFSDTIFDCHLPPELGDKLHSKTLYIAIFAQRSSIVKSVFHCRLSNMMSDA